MVHSDPGSVSATLEGQGRRRRRRRKLVYKKEKYNHNLKHDFYDISQFVVILIS